MPSANGAGGAAPPALLATPPIIQADLAALTERVRRRVMRWFRLARLLDAAAAADMLAWENSGFSVDASLRITLNRPRRAELFSEPRASSPILRPAPLRARATLRDPQRRRPDRPYPARSATAQSRHLGRARPRSEVHAARRQRCRRTHAVWFLDRLAALVPPPRKHRHRYHGVFAPNHTLRPAVTALAIGNVGKRQEAEAVGHASDGHGAGGCCDAAHTHQKPRSHDTSRIAWAKLMARVGEKFPLECPNCGGDIRLIAFITEPGPIRKILTPVLLHTEWRTARASARLARWRPASRLARARADTRRSGILPSVARRSARDRHPQPLSSAGREAAKPRQRPTGIRSAPRREILPPRPGQDARPPRPDGAAWQRG